MSSDVELDRDMLLRAARLAIRGRGGAEPNPVVGCLITDATSKLVGWGFHRRCGEDHAEIMALKRAGDRARGGTAYVTLEPCNHTGQTGPCAEALIKAKIARVVIGRNDPNPQASGGAACLREASIDVEIIDDLDPVLALTDPFVHRLTTGLPWIIAKWAQTIDGRIATSSRQSKWISNQRSRRLVHRERGRVDGILTGIGTVLADDPLLTARNVRVRRLARRIVIDPKLQIPMESKLVTTAQEIPLSVACNDSLLRAGEKKIAALESAGVEVLGIEMGNEVMPLASVLKELAKRHELTNIMVEAGAGLLGKLFEQKLVNEAWVFIAPKLLGDEKALPCVKGFDTPVLSDAQQFTLITSRQRGNDIVLRYRSCNSF